MPRRKPRRCCTELAMKPWPVCWMTPLKNSRPLSGGQRAWKAPWHSCKSVSQSGLKARKRQQIHAVQYQLSRQAQRQRERRCQGGPPKNLGGHGWPERSAHGCARSGFLEALPPPCPLHNPQAGSKQSTGSNLLVILPAKLNNRLYERPGMLRIHIRCNPMSKIENMPGTGAIALEDVRHFLANPRLRRIQHCRVHIALQCYLIAYTSTGITDIRGPVQTHRIGATVSDGLKPLATVLGKYDDRHPTAFVFTNQTIHNLLHITQ